MVEREKRLGYLSLVDYVPEVESYEHDTLVEFSSIAEGVQVVMTMEPMHNEDWTQRLVAGNELDNLAKLIDARRSSAPPIRSARGGLAVSTAFRRGL